MKNKKSGKYLRAFSMLLVFVLTINLNWTCCDKVNASGYEHAWFPVSVMNLTQIAYESYSHYHSNHIDCTGSQYAFAPFTGKIVNASNNYGVTLFQSLNKVYYADGTLDYMTVMFMHGTPLYSIGTVVSQGKNFYKIGGRGSGGTNQYPSHYDIGIYKGRKSTFGAPYSSFGNTYAFNAFYINTSKTTSIWNKGKLENGNTVNNNAPKDWTNLWVNLNGSSIPSGNIHVTYQVYDDVANKFLDNVTDSSDYAGVKGHDITAVYASLSSGNITYRVHVKGGSWLAPVKNRTDYAGITYKPIDGIMMTTDTGKTIHYKVRLRRTGKWLSYATGYNRYDSNNGYAGVFGQEIDGLRIYIS